MSSSWHWSFLLPNSAQWFYFNAKDWKPAKKYCTSPPSTPPSPRVILVELWLMSDEINWKHLMCLTCKGLGLYSLRVRDFLCFINSEDTEAWISALQPDDLLNSTLTPAIIAAFHSIINRRRTWTDGSKNGIKSPVAEMLLILVLCPSLSIRLNQAVFPSAAVENPRLTKWKGILCFKWKDGWGSS